VKASPSCGCNKAIGEQGCSFCCKVSSSTFKLTPGSKICCNPFFDERDQLHRPSVRDVSTGRKDQQIGLNYLIIIIIIMQLDLKISYLASSFRRKTCNSNMNRVSRQWLVSPPNGPLPDPCYIHKLSPETPATSIISSRCCNFMFHGLSPQPS